MSSLDWRFDEQQAFDDIHVAVAAANAAPYGLAAFVFTENGHRARHLAAVLDVCMVGVNVFRISAADSPFAGVNDSGFGREGGSWGLKNFTTVKAISEA